MADMRDELFDEEIDPEIKKAAEEIEQLMKPDEEDKDLDSPDGFRRFIAKKLAKISCLSGASEKTIDDTASGSLRSITSEDFKENKTAYAHPKPEEAEDWESDVYNFSYPKRGLAVIINNEKFSESREFDDRPGSSYDASALYHTFRLLGFDVFAYNNLQAWKMVEVLKLAAKQYDHKNADCFVCSILTHGDQTWTDREYDRLGTKVRHDLLFGTDGRAVATKTLVELFSDKECPGLKGKPRLFFLQACRGNKYDDGQTIPVRRPLSVQNVHRRRGRDAPDNGRNVDQTDKSQGRQHSLSSSVDPPEYHLTDATDARPEKETEAKTEDNSGERGEGDGDKTDAKWFGVRDVPVSPAPLYKDCLVMYATPPGHFAWRRKTGAWFVQSLCKHLDGFSKVQKSLQLVLTSVTRMVALDYQSENPSRLDMHEKKETPVIESMLIKDVYMMKKRTA